MNKDFDVIALSIRMPKELYDEIAKEKEKENRSCNQQILYWIRLGKLLDSNPDMKLALQLKEQLR